MRAGARILTIGAAVALTAAVGGGWGSALSAPAYAPTTSILAPADAPSGTLALERAHTGSVRIGTEVIAEGVPVPRGTSSVGPAHSFVDGHLRGWETVLDLGGVPPSTALAALRADLVAQGFDVRTGSHDIFGARLRSGRWEIVVARAQARVIDHRTRQVLKVGVGSRAA